MDIDYRAALMLLACLSAGQAAAQDQTESQPDAEPLEAIADAPPSPSEVELPDIVFGSDPNVAKDGYKFFFFHNPDLSFDEAYADFAECRTQLATGSFLPLPGFVPWVEENNRKLVVPVNNYGLVGAAIGAIIQPKLERGILNNKMRLCMGRRGYVRYAMNEAAYDAIWDAEPSDSIAMQAKLATGPAPQADEVTE